MARDEQSPPEAHAPLIGGKYRLGRILGEGGMGSVYEAEHVGLGKTVAVKLLNEIFTTDASAVSRFRREARTAAAIRHPNIVSVTDTGTDDEGVPFIVMELVDGESLSALLRRERVLPPGDAAHIAGQLLAGLTAAHKKGVIHRDLKPGNILVRPRADGTRQVKILDFGISKFISDVAQDVTQLGAVIGTPRFMAPEQARGEPLLDGRVDIYAVGVLLYRMLTGKLPFTGRTQDEVIEQTIAAKIKAPREINAQLSEDLEQVVLTAMAAEPDDRFVDADAFIAALIVAEPGLPPLTRDDNDDIEEATPTQVRKSFVSGVATRTSAPPIRSTWRQPWIYAAALVLAALVAGGTYLISRPPSPRAGRAPTDGGARDGPPLTFGIARYLPSDQLQKAKASLLGHLSKVLDRPVRLVVIDDFVDLAGRMHQGKLDLAALSSCDYVRAKRRYPGLRLLASHVTREGSTYQGYIVSRADSEVHQLSDLRGRVFCYTNVKSCSGYSYPRALLRRHGMDPDKDFSHTRFAGDHLRALRALHLKACDGAAVFAGLLLDGSKHDMAPQTFRILATTASIPYDAYCASPRLDPVVADKVKRALLALKPGSPAALRALGPRSRITGFISVEDEAYDRVREEKLDDARE